MEDFDGDRWRGTPAADAAYKQEELRWRERGVIHQSDAPPRYSQSHTAHLSQFGNTWTRQTQSANQHLSVGENLCHLSSDQWNLGPR